MDFFEDTDIQERIEMMASGGRGFSPVKPKMPRLDSPIALNIHLGFMDTTKRMAMGEGVTTLGTMSSYSGRTMNLFDIPNDVYDYILWENRCLEGEARRAIIREYSH